MISLGPILIVDDDKDQRWLQRTLLERVGFGVEEASSRDAAKLLLESHRFAVAVLDISGRPRFHARRLAPSDLPQPGGPCSSTVRRGTRP